jgi:methyl acetate hydrolase
VEQGRVKLDEPVSQHLPQLGKLEVLEGFDPQTGEARLRPAGTPVTLKHLLTHTSGMSYDVWGRDMFQYTSKTKGAVPAVPPLMFEPGMRWQYGMGVDWAGRLVEVVGGMNLEEYFQAKILGPLEMRDTSYLIRRRNSTGW